MFRNFPTSPQLVRNGLGLLNDLFAATGKTPQSAVFMHANDTFGLSAKAAFDIFMPQLNFPFKVLDSISYDPRAQDLSVEVAKAKADQGRAAAGHDACRRCDHDRARAGQAALRADGRDQPRQPRHV
ncbi:MAG: hypothetical protein WDO24_03965 [Pseudomonadota bacterium]